MTLQDFLRALRHRWWIVVACIVLGGGAGALAATLQQPVYRATATLFVTTAGPDAAGSRESDNSFVQARADTYADLARTSTVLEPAADVLGNVTEGELLTQVESATREGTNLIDITSNAPSAAAAADVVNVVAGSLAQQVNLLEAPTGATAATDSQVVLRVVQEGAAPTAPVSPDLLRTLMVGVLVGFAGGIGATVLAQSLSGRLRSPRDVAGLSGIVPTSLPEAQGPQRREAYRALRSSLRHTVGARGAVVLSPVQPGASPGDLPDELARAFGEVGATTLLIDADFRADSAQRRRRERPSVGDDTPGLAQVLTGEFPLALAVVAGQGTNTWLLPTGEIHETSAQLLSSDEMSRLLEEVSGSYDYVLVIAPPLLERSEAIVLASQARTTVLVVEARTTRRSELLFTLERIYAVGVTSVSLVLNAVSRLDMQPARVRYSAGDAGTEATAGAAGQGRRAVRTGPTNQI